MKFLVDAQLPHRLSLWLKAERHDAVHTRDLPERNRTVDTTINQLSIREQRVVITKDEDFVDLFLLRHEPYKLLLVATGNIDNKELQRLFQNNLDAIVQAFETFDFVELDRTSLTCHW
jgi:predicted nuclease of predicted toxin-antitoxin system